MLEHRTRDGVSRLLPRCSLPITAAGVVTLVVTDLGLFAPMGEGFALRDLAPAVSLDEVRAATACPIIA
jgi:acyl CoA:acetate/3-ketoacid CoA transferase beta subunit